MELYDYEASPCRLQKLSFLIAFDILTWAEDGFNNILWSA